MNGKLLLGLGATLVGVAVGAVTIAREFGTGLPPWLAIRIHPLRPKPPPERGLEGDREYASQGFQLVIGRWVPVTELWYAPNRAVGAIGDGGPPIQGRIFAQVIWKWVKDSWQLISLDYYSALQEDSLKPGAGVD